MAAARRLFSSAAAKAARTPMAPPMAGVTLFDPPALTEPSYQVRLHCCLDLFFWLDFVKEKGKHP